MPFRVAPPLTASRYWPKVTELIVDPGGMLVKNFAFLVLAWVSASLPAWR